MKHLSHRSRIAAGIALSALLTSPIGAAQSVAAAAQSSRCGPNAAAEHEESAHARSERCATAPVVGDPPAKRAAAAPPAAKRVLPPDANKEERVLREKVHRALRRHERGTATQVTPECQAIVRQIAAEQPLLRSLRADTRMQAREKMSALTNAFRDQGC